MRTISELEILDLLDDVKIDELENEMPPLDDYPAVSGWLSRGVKEGFFHACTFKKDGEPIVDVVYSLACDPERVLNVNAFVGLAAFDDEFLVAGIHKLAEQNECVVIEFTTRRRGLVEKTQKFGWKAHSVVMRKRL